MPDTYKHDGRLTASQPRIGIYAGAFDPVHTGHITFALQAIEAGNLDEVVFMPERQPRYKPGVEHYAHRIAMVKSAARPHPKLSVLEMVDRRFTVLRTLPQLNAIFPGAQLVMLMGSDTAFTVPHWQYSNRLLETSEFIVGLRPEHSRQQLQAVIDGWQDRGPVEARLIRSFAGDVSSQDIRTALRSNRGVRGLLASVRRYARQEWLYVSPGTYAGQKTGEDYA